MSPDGALNSPPPVPAASDSIFSWRSWPYFRLALTLVARLSRWMLGRGLAGHDLSPGAIEEFFGAAGRATAICSPGELWRRFWISSLP